jgi:hypothetical protein
MFTDNLKGFRKRIMIKKLEILMEEIKNVIDYAYEEDPEDYSMEGAVEHANYLKDRVEELESQYSMIWRIKLQLEKGMRTSKSDLDYVNEVHKEIGLGKY